MLTKTCGNCSQELPLDTFHKGTGKHGRVSYCKPCVRKYQKENRDKINKAGSKWRRGNGEYMKDYYAANKEQRQEQNREYAANHREEARERSARWREDNPTRHKDQLTEYYQQNRERELAKSKDRHKKNRKANCTRSKQWRLDNPDRVAAQTALRRACKKQAVPLWANTTRMETFYVEAKKLTEETGVSYQVDHIVPLNSDVVCGLHCEDNLRVITAEENNAKKNALLEELL